MSRDDLLRNLRADNLRYAVDNGWIDLTTAVLWALQGRPPVAWSGVRINGEWRPRGAR